MSSSHCYSCWTDPRMQKSHEREFVKHFSSSKYAVSRNNYDDLIKRVGNIFGPNDKIRNSFEVKDCSVNGEWIVRLVDKEQNRILLPLEDIFAEIESLHMKGNHKPKTPLHNELKQIYFYPSRPMVEFVLDRCPVCLERRKTKVPDEPVHANLTSFSELRKDCTNFQRKKLDAPQDPVIEIKNTAGKSQVSVSVERAAQRAFNGISNLVQASTSALPSSSTAHSFIPPCLNSPISISEKPSSATAQSKSVPSFLTSTPVERDRSARPQLVPLESSFFSPNLALPKDMPNESRISVDSNFIRFLNNSNVSQSDHQYLSIISEELTTDSGKATKPIGKSIEEEKVLSLAAAIKTEAEDFEFDLQECSLPVNEETKNKILLDLERECFGKWRKMQSRSNPAHQYYYNSQTGTSQNELPTIWEQEIKERSKKELSKRRSSSEKGQPVEDRPSITNDLEDIVAENAKKGSDSGEAPKITKEGGTLATEVSSIARPFNDTNDAMGLLFANGPSKENSARDKPTDEDGMLQLRDFCNTFQEELAEEFDILDQGTVSLISKDDANQTIVASDQMENLNLENIPIDESIGGADAWIEDSHMEKRHPSSQKILGKVSGAVNLPKSAAIVCAGNAAPLDSATSVSTSNAKRATSLVTTISSDKIQLANQKLVSKFSANFGKRKEIHTARKRSSRPKEAAFSARTVESSSDLSEESSEEDVKRPPPLLLHKMPRCKVLVKRITKTSIQKQLSNLPPKKSSKHLSSVKESSPAQNTFQRRTRNSSAFSSSYPIKQELFQCVKCTRTRTFIGEIAYHLHELARHRNCVSANEYLIDYMEKLMPSGLMEISFCCLLCDQTYDCDQYWGHMSEKHNAEIGARHRRISRTISSIKEGKAQQKFNIKKEFLSDSEDDEARDKTWNGRDGEWMKLELGTRNRRRTGQGSGVKRVKIEGVE